MPSIPTYTEQVLPQGAVNAQATPNDFGAQIGQGEQQLGQGLGEAAHIADRIVQDQGRIWAYDASSKSYEKMHKSLTDQVNALDPNDPDFTSKVAGLTSNFSQQLDDETKTLQESAPSRSAARFVGSHMAMNSRTLLNAAMSEQARISGAYTGKLMSDGMKSDQDAIAADPSDANYNRIVANRTANIGGLMTVDPVKKIEWQAQLEHGLAVTQVQTRAAVDGPGFLQQVNAQGGHTTLRGNVRGAVPGGAAPDLGADTVKPYSPARVQSIADVVNAPSQYDDTFKAEAAKNGVDWKDLKMRAVVESALNPNAVGPKTPNGQSVGIMQIEKGNATRAGIDPTNPQQSIAWAAAALAGYGKKAGGDASAVDKSYYGGEDQSKWGKNTAQYAANLGAVRAAMGGASDTPQVQPLTDAQVAGANPPIAGWGKLTWQEKVASVRQAEAAVGGALAQSRGEMDRDLKDASTSLLAGKNFAGLDSPRFSQDNLTKLYGPVDGPRKFDQLQYVKQVGGFIGQMSTMPVAQAESTLQNLAPQGGHEFADKQPVFHAAMEAYQRLGKLRNDDYMQWALNNKVGGAQPLDMTSPDKFQDSLHQRISVASAGINDYHANASLMSKGEVDAFGDALSRMNPQQQMGYIKAIRLGTAGHDDWFRDEMTQLAPKNTTIAQAAVAATRTGNVATAAGPQDGNTVGQYILEGAHILQGKDIDDPQHTGRPLALDDAKLRGFFWNSVGTGAFQSPDAQRSSQIANDTYQSVKNYLAADLYHRGLDPKNITQAMVGNAVNAVTGGTVKNNRGDQLFVPWGMAKDQFQQEFPQRAQAAIDAAGYKGTALDSLDAYHFVNLDDGKYGFMNGNRMLVDKTGRTVTVDFKNPLAAPPAPPAAPPNKTPPAGDEFAGIIGGGL